MNEQNFPRVIFPEWFDERVAYEMPLKGWGKACVEIDDKQRYSLYFCDPIRLQQDLALETERGHPYFAEPGMVIVPEVTIENIEKAVVHLWNEGFFEHLKPE